MVTALIAVQVTVATFFQNSLDNLTVDSKVTQVDD